MIDKALSDKLEELGIKELFTAFAESLVSVRTSRAASSIRSTHANYAVTTLRLDSCTCGALDSKRGQYIPEQPHERTCPWALFLELFADKKTIAEEAALTKEFRRWAERVNSKPDDEPHRNVSLARRFLQKSDE